MFITILFKILELTVRLCGILLEIVEAWSLARDLPPILLVIAPKPALFSNYFWLCISKLIFWIL
jgi:hypothetical protein